MKRLRFIGLILVGLSVVGVGWAKSPGQGQSEQSLGDLARKNRAQQEQRSHPGRVFTNDDTKRPLSLSLPDKSWAVEVLADGFTLESDQSEPGGRGRIMANNPATGVVISVQMEQVDHKPGLEECRQSQRDRVKDLSRNFHLQDVKYWDDGKMTFMEYLIPEYQGRPVRQRNLFACFFKEDVFIDVHLSKALFEPEDERMLSAVLGAVHVTDPDAQTPSGSGSNSMELFRKGSLLYNQKRFRDAIEPYQKALDLEKKDPRLEKNYWRVLVDNLGMAYGITGDLNNAKATFDYGVSQDRSYPMFYYNLACTYAEMKDLDNAMANLKTAFENKQNAIPGEGLPDPRQDDSFQHFMKNEEFRKLANSLVNSSK